MTPLNERHDLAMKIEALLLKPGVRAAFEQEIGVFNDWCAEWKKGDAKWRKKHGYLFRKSRSARYRADLPAWEPGPWDRLCSVAVRDPDPRLSPLTVSLYGVTGDPPLSDAGRRLCLSWVGLAILHDLALQDDARVALLAVALDHDHVQITQEEMVGKWASWKPVMEMGVKVVEAELEKPDQKQTEQRQPGEADEGRRVPMGDVRAKIVREVKDAFVQWRTAGKTYGPDTSDAKRYGGCAMRLLYRSVGVLDECQRDFGASGVTLEILKTPVHVADRFTDGELERMGTDNYYATTCKDQFIDDLHRWEERLDRKGQASPVAGTEQVDERWSRPMPLTDMADRILKDSKKTRKLKSVYGKHLKKIGDKSWIIRLDGLPPNIIKELDRP
jgi:hypothetical protein